MENITCKCGKTFTRKCNFVRHQRTSCNYGDKINYECKYCSKSFARKYILTSHKTKCIFKNEYLLKKDIDAYKRKVCRLKENVRTQETELIKKEEYTSELAKIIEEKDKIIRNKDEEISLLKLSYETGKLSGKVEVYDKVCTKVLDKSTVTNNTAYIHPKLVNLPITTIHPLTEGYVKDRVDNGGYTFDNYLKGENGLVDFIYSITMCENDDGSLERNYVCTDPTRDSYHRLVETKEWQKDKGGKFVDVILDTLSDKVDDYHHKMLDERISKTRKSSIGYDPDYIYKLNTDMHSGVVQSHGKDRRTLRQKIKKETSRKISV